VTAGSPPDPLLATSDWQRLRRWYRRHGRHELPWRNNRTPWRVLLAETLLHRTRANSVAVLYPAVTEEFPTPATVVERPERWRELTRSAGLAWRAESFIRACSELVYRHGNRVPGETAALKELPGIGHYVASAVVCFGFGQRAMLVDTNTIRLAARISGEDLHPERHRSRAVRDVVSRLGPEGEAPDADDNFALLDLAALVCTPREPRCMLCPLRESCVTGRSRTETVGNNQGEDGR
jgi:A/G-specific adenine glycosylase